MLSLRTIIAAGLLASLTTSVFGQDKRNPFTGDAAATRQGAVLFRQECVYCHGVCAGGAGVLSTAGGLVFSCDGQGNFIALDATTGRDLWHVLLGAPIQTAAVRYGVDRRQYISIVAGGSLFTFALAGAN